MLVINSFCLYQVLIYVFCGHIVRYRYDHKIFLVSFSLIISNILFILVVSFALTIFYCGTTV